MALWRYVVFLAVIALLGWGMVGVMSQKSKLASDADALRAELSTLENENRLLESDITYYASEENLVKALKEQFNYRAPDEKLLILVKPSTSTKSTPRE